MAYVRIKSKVAGCFIYLTSLALAGVISAHGLENGLARTPPMGWNSWNKFGCQGINEKVVREAADAIASNGMKDAGYQFVVIDDCWQTGRDAAGNIVADAERFPSGIKALADYVHGKGLKFGIYTDAGTMTCANRPGSVGHEYQDARQYANWGVDYLKEDWCNILPGQSSESSYTLMRNALASTNRPIVFSICEWGSTKPWLWASSIGNLWRATDDIQDCWSCKRSWGGKGVVEILDKVNGLESFAGPGHWNDLDMLEVGNGGMTKEEYQAHFSMWALLSAPLLAGTDLAHMTPDTKEILLNEEVIAVDQDTMGLPGRRVKKMDELEVWSKQLADGGRAVALLNRSDKPAIIVANWQDVGYPSSLAGSVRDLWAKKDLGRRVGSYSAEVPRHGVVLVTVQP
jgi:alpha-galactosidase